MPPKIHIDPDKLKSFMRLKPTLRHTASFFDCNESTIVRFIKENYGKTFFEFRDMQMNNTRHALIQTAVAEALGSKEKRDDSGKVIAKGKSVNTALMIFALKNLCEWSDHGNDESQGKEDNLIFIDDEDPEGNELAVPVKDASETD